MSASRSRRRVGFGLVGGWLIAPLFLSALVTAGGGDESSDRQPVVYAADEAFPIGGSKTLRESASDACTVVAAGVTVFEALAACHTLAEAGVRIRVVDAYSLQPVDADGLVAAARATGGRLVTVEDHYAAGGLGDAVSDAVAPHGIAVRRLAVRDVPRSGKPAELLDRFGISARHIVAAVEALVGAGSRAVTT
jgi:transketolase